MLLSMCNLTLLFIPFRSLSAVFRTCWDTGQDLLLFLQNRIALFLNDHKRMVQVQGPVTSLHSVIRLPIHSGRVCRPPACSAQQTDNIHKHVADGTKTRDSRKRHLQRQIPVGVCHKAGWVAGDWGRQGNLFIYLSFKVCKASPKYHQVTDVHVH